MNHKKYAKLLNWAWKKKTEKEFSLFFDNFITILKKKNQIKLLPSILSELKKIKNKEDKDKKTKLVVKNRSMTSKYQNEFNEYSSNFDLDNLEIEESQNIIGGYILKNKKYKVDNSYKKKLLTLYNKIVS